MPDTSIAALIPVAPRQIGTETKQTVNAKDLHTFLGVKSEYIHWFSRRVKTYEFSQGIDYTDVTFGEGPMKTIEHHVTFDMAKELSMVERTAKGKEARLYFLDCERQVQDRSAALDAYPELRALADMARTIGTLVTQTAESRAVAEQAQRDATAANLKADLALAQQLWLTLREFAYTRQLTHQMPLSVCKDFGTYLTGYCLEHDIPVRDVPIAAKAWKHEHAYHVELIDQLLPKWLKRHNSQMAIVPSRTAKE